MDEHLRSIADAAVHGGGDCVAHRGRELPKVGVYAILTANRARVVSAARGLVLEIGVGSGLNLPFYMPGVERVVGLDPSARLLRMARRHGAPAGAPPFDLLRASAEAVPLRNASIVTIVMTWSLCSIPDASRALGEMRRVLRPDGALVFVEHGAAPDPGVAAWQDGLTPAWRRVAGGCHLNRSVERLIGNAGFTVVDLRCGYMAHGPRPFTFMYDGRAHPR